ncbi:D-hexose-6-phosphate mutarotase [Pseudoxanthomonas dokdonensis]|uniref:Putative glucose-6-phosphate 1-epimerase n=1 Tax=Pseudoxanthomonas dokdonensis TaxID=344882 RepID=A0A0R0CS83_9GAMM|nr:D-hexose-6-phosphate mutarotase [Pseudoxanthomonas dokdonensis]KRG68468.1 hypothetical protein ABB29_12640 [Pseudoxanthomonas dokdonensis]
MSELPSGISFSEFAGIPVWQVQTAHAFAAISQFGGQLLSWHPTDEEEVLWMSPQPLRAPRPIRGGVPICWPYFARQGQSADAPQHGHARVERWQLSRISKDADGSVMLQIELPADHRTPLRLQQQIHVGRHLRQRLITSHESRSSAVASGGDGVRDDQRPELALTQALHSYFRVADVETVRIQGVEDLDYADNYDKAVHQQHGAWQLDDPRDPGRSDRIYRTSGSHFELIDAVARRRVDIRSEGSQSLVIWNPGRDAAQAMVDVPGESWRDFVCVEVANAGEDVVALAPGQQHVLQQTVSLARL